MKIYAQILGTCTGDTTPSLLIFFDQRRYLFNCGEGTQRFCIEHKVRLKKISHIFLTKLSWDFTGGIPGALLTLADSNPGADTCISLYGPRYTRNFVAALRYFINRRRLNLQVTEFTEGETSEEEEKEKGKEVVEEGTSSAVALPLPVFDDGSLTVIPVELLLEGEPPLKTCRSLTEPMNVAEDYPRTSHKQVEETGSASNSYASIATTTISATIARKRGSNGRTKSAIPDAGSSSDSNNAAPGKSTVPAEDNSTKVRRTTVIDCQPFGTSRSSKMVLATPWTAKRVKPTEIAAGMPASSVTEHSSEETHIQDEKMFLDSEMSKAEIRPRPSIVEAPPGPSSAVLCYICRSPDLPGKFDAQRAKQLGVPPGPLYGRLTKGETITTPAGTQVQPSDCISPPRPGTVFIIVHCPSKAYVPVLTGHRAWQDYVAASAGRQVGCIVHITPADIIEEDKHYLSWMHSFGQNTQHILMNEKHCSKRVVFRSSAVNICKLNTLHSSIFSPPFSTNDPLPVPEGLPLRTTVGELMMKFLLAPPEKVGLDISEIVPPLNLQEIYGEVSQNTEFQECRTQFLEWAATATKAEPMDVVNDETSSMDTELVFFGTGAALPSKYRNVSSAFVDVAGVGGIFFDSGEGTLGQMTRKYGYERIDEMLLRLRCVLISHMHADHHLGLIRILLRRQELQQAAAAKAMSIESEDLLVVGPTALHHWLTEYKGIEDIRYRFISCRQLTTYSTDFERWREYFNREMGFSEFSAVPVIHCPDAYAFIIQHSKLNWKIVYSGDTRPSEVLAATGKDATLLIHEATFEDELASEAVEKNHSTTGEALYTASRMNAKFVMLTHFSQRYPKIPVINEGLKDITGIAFDLLSAKLSQLHILPKLIPALQCLFKEEEEEGEDEQEDESLHTKEKAKEGTQGRMQKRLRTQSKRESAAAEKVKEQS
ncbi:TRNase Z endonuclease [Balamuthia mandrillaris]